MSESLVARRILIRGVVQGVGFRPFVYRLAQRLHLTGWVLNGTDGVEIHIEGSDGRVQSFIEALWQEHPPAAQIAALEIHEAPFDHGTSFDIKPSRGQGTPVTRISADLRLCAVCRREMSDPDNRRYRYPYINCTDCGPRYSIILRLPYDRPNTTMHAWTFCAACAAEYHDPENRRFHAQPVACPECGPHYVFRDAEGVITGDVESIAAAARALSEGKIVAIKGLGGYHLACDALNVKAVEALRQRKYRKDKAFAIMVRDLEVAQTLVTVDKDVEALLTSTAAPIVLAPARCHLPGIAPGNRQFGVMLPYTPLHYLLYDYGAPPILVMTSANRSSEPIAYQDDDAAARLSGIADGFLIGERPIARRVDDSVVQIGPFGPMMIRRARGYAPSVVAQLPVVSTPILAVGADLKNSVTLVVEGQAMMSQHLGDLEHWAAFESFQQAIEDLRAVYGIREDDLVVVHDMHPEYRSSAYASGLPARYVVGIQHHRAHIAAVLAERGAWDVPVVGVAFDGTGYGDDGTIWGGEFFVGSLTQGFDRVGHLRPATLVGGDAAGRSPVQAAVGYLAQLASVQDWTQPPFEFPSRFKIASALFRKGVRCFSTTSVGRLFDTVAALLGFTQDMTFEAQAAIWLEQLAWNGKGIATNEPSLWDGRELDFRPLLDTVVRDRLRGHDPAAIAYGFHHHLAYGIAQAVSHLARQYSRHVAVVSGGVFQNVLLLSLLKEYLESKGIEVWTGSQIPVNDGGISLGQAALAWATIDRVVP
ncbi:Acylphosphatase (plasmid) [Sulfobacillus acidophilus DSM 10332]|uniref:Carbamoyltransferase n=1 Tax=Sulfobacillus acidophilus (strain ATCC 700253 / DSM 10332 / NAL) TaxID=679936 RepID=G8U1T8_SULAD|nr:Acylphosphatase [Sulfobacillus acidophilus DSM 10332]